MKVDFFRTHKWYWLTYKTYKYRGTPFVLFRNNQSLRHVENILRNLFNAHTHTRQCTDRLCEARYQCWLLKQNVLGPGLPFSEPVRALLSGGNFQACWIVGIVNTLIPLWCHYIWSRCKPWTAVKSTLLVYFRDFRQWRLLTLNIVATPLLWSDDVWQGLRQSEIFIQRRRYWCRHVQLILKMPQYLVRWDAHNFTYTSV